jgi:hypothetical protein
MKILCQKNFVGLQQKEGGIRVEQSDEIGEGDGRG